jgi:hypothetical protein
LNYLDAVEKSGTKTITVKAGDIDLPTAMGVMHAQLLTVRLLLSSVSVMFGAVLVAPGSWYFDFFASAAAVAF